ncbi:hypothetical protein GCM10010425_73480 [Streptomyces spororaveus]|uniref:Lipoprotein n=1 Tax=Streptomyces spororaveus TaxID=284039 RepID=A0ABQ3T489_9ACTN|nr:hypothetical protein [Streptomyces spororaveus]GHI75198.1 hypothetical protein Sspor_07590 [Streptomyces spororaveus]
MTKTAVSVTGRLVVAGLLCAALAGCGTTRTGQAAPPAGVPTLVRAECDLDVPTDEETGGYAGPPTDQETGAYAGPPTDEETGGYAGPPTDEETGGYAGPPTDQETGGYAGPPTDGEMTDGGGPCGPADWFDMTRDFTAYYVKHAADDGYAGSEELKEVRVRKVRTVGEARITFTTREVGKGRGDAARSIAALFAAWRHEVYGDTGTLTLRTATGARLDVTASW